MIERLLIYGVGLIGGSVALALKQAGAVGEVIGVGRSRANLDLARTRGIVDRIAEDVEAAAAEADLILLALPVGAMAKAFARIAPALGDKTVVTDAGSTKQDVIAAARAALLAVRKEIAKAVVGQDAVISGLVIALLCRGHVLLEGVPGVAKTLLVRALAAALHLDFKRVQFTPDLMPGDVTGSLVYDARTSAFAFREVPVFTNLLLADEINRTPPKTQAALLEAMEERQVSVDGQPRPLPDPFIVAATQNPIEYEGTYQLPEAQLDRFLLKLNVPLPSRDQRSPSWAGMPRASTRGTWPGSAPWRAPRNWPPDGRRSPRCWWPTRFWPTSSTSSPPQGIPRRCNSVSRHGVPPPCWPLHGRGPGLPGGAT